MSGTLKMPKQEPRRDLTATVLHIAEYDRGTLKLVQDWPVAEYPQKAVALQARAVVDEFLARAFPDPAHAGTRPLTDQDLAAIRHAVADVGA